MGIFERLGVQSIINVTGSVTRLGGAPMPSDVVSAYGEAALQSVPMDELQAAASRSIARATGAESGLVTNGAAGALMLGAAAILTRLDIQRMEVLPDSSRFPHEFLIAREQRNGYDHAVRAAGVKFIEVGFHEPVAGSGVRRCEPWEFAGAVGPNTAGVLYVYDVNARPQLCDVVQVAHEQQLPVLVDAAGELPPRANLTSIIQSGADLVAFSGGKGIRGPQATGILAGRRELISAAALQMLDMDDYFELWDPPVDLIDKSKLKGMPRHGIGRALKVSKEQIASLIVALELFQSGAYDRHAVVARGYLERISATLNGRPVSCRILGDEDGQSIPRLEIALSGRNARDRAFDICRRLRRGTPPIYVGHGQLEQGVLVVHPLHLNEEQTEIVRQRLFEVLDREPVLAPHAS